PYHRQLAGDCELAAGPHEAVDGVRRQWGREVKALHEVAAELLEAGELVRVFDALGDRRQTEGMGHLDDGLGDGGILGARRQTLHERLVDLDRVERELTHIPDRRVAGAEVVDGQTHTEVTNLRQFPAYRLDILDEGGL